jgi:predicted nucleic acid-binding protein
LDVNLMLALFQPDHVHHERAHEWWDEHRAEGWASCPLTQNGFARILSQPRYPQPVTVARALDHLAEQVAETGPLGQAACAALNLTI